ncbi:PTS system fructose subfamily IIA component [Coriobacterium glomerans PW2]|uniref:PTS system fructose subfamily IIA component n=1 Tax=Coriobacterium glomerans (strain ATCC 49209 / DSM 20642 / JCM 10262 / PW2) TaxID=700015 RepID=F2NAJ4_CORGP|nr:PTS sugar transporter subunit IIA [Coriobacterium glomerans]AEB06521.1 PTS system fructose subfamily IIA component [Coriobacterium glomerans PW2]
MVGFVLTGHGKFASGLGSAIDMVAGDQPAFRIVPFEVSAAATYGSDLRSAIAEMRAECEGVIVFVDLLGGTPFNQAMMISQDIADVEIVTGTNLPMLIELLLTRGSGSPIGELVAQALAVGKAGIDHKQITADSDGDGFDEDEDGI